MVRRIDGAARRRLLAESVWEIIRRDGLEAVTVRAVAAEAGLATGSVRHFFHNQADLHAFAMEELERTVTSRVAAALDTGTPSVDRALLSRLTVDGAATPSTRRRVLAALVECLPLSPETAALYRAHLLFVTKALVDPGLRAVADRTFVELQDFYEQLIGSLVEHGHAPNDLDRPAAVDDLATLMDGLAFRLLVTPALLPPERALDQLERFLDSLDVGAARS